MVTWSTVMPRSASSSSTSRYDSPKRRSQRTARTITSDGKQKPAKADCAMVGRGRRGLMRQSACSGLTRGRCNSAVEVKWGIHPAGDNREAWQTGEQRTTALLLVKGRFRIELSTGSFVLEREGDYAVWGPGINHSRYAEADSVVITARWPSLPQ